MDEKQFKRITGQENLKWYTKTTFELALLS